MIFNSFLFSKFLLTCLQTFAPEVIKEDEVTLTEEFIPCHFGEIEGGL